MQKIKHILSNDERFIVENHFLHNKKDSRQNYIKFCREVFGKYTESDLLRNLGEENRFSIELIWDEVTETTAIMHCFGHKKYDHSNSKMKALMCFNGDLNFQNKNGQTATMFLSKHFDNLFHLYEMLTKSNKVDAHLYDKENKSFHIYMLENFSYDFFTPEALNEDDRIRVGRLINRMEIFTHVIEDWFESSVPKDQNLVNIVLDGGSKMLDRLKVMNNARITCRSLNESAVKKVLYDRINDIEKLTQLINLHTTLPLKNETKARAKI